MTVILYLDYLDFESRNRGHLVILADIITPEQTFVVAGMMWQMIYPFQNAGYMQKTFQALGGSHSHLLSIFPVDGAFGVTGNRNNMEITHRTCLHVIWSRTYRA